MTQINYILKSEGDLFIGAYNGDSWQGYYTYVDLRNTQYDVSGVGYALLF